VRTVEGFPPYRSEVGREEAEQRNLSEDKCSWSTRRGAVAARRAHNPKVTGSNPVAATNACVTSAVDPPRPIPNRVVKRRSADATGA
jgi:hypothetical protein